MINPAAQEGQLGAQRSQASNPLYSFGTLHVGLKNIFLIYYPSKPPMLFKSDALRFMEFPFITLGGFTPQNMLSTGQTPQNLVGSL